MPLWYPHTNTVWHTQNETKWSSFRRRYFRMHIDCICKNMWEAITWTHDKSIHGSIYESRSLFNRFKTILGYHERRNIDVTHWPSAWRCGSYFKDLIFKPILHIYITSISRVVLTLSFSITWKCFRMNATELIHDANIASGEDLVLLVTNHYLSWPWIIQTLIPMNLSWKVFKTQPTALEATFLMLLCYQRACRRCHNYY